MTKKRFRLLTGERIHTGEIFYDGYTHSFEEVVDLLNALHEENQALKEKISFLEEFITSGVEHTYSQNIYDENEQLKQLCSSQQLHINKLQHENNGLIEHLGRLEEENGRLKHWNKCLAEKRHKELLD
jgi:hypothetical protein